MLLSTFSSASRFLQQSAQARKALEADDQRVMKAPFSLNEVCQIQGFALVARTSHLKGMLQAKLRHGNASGKLDDDCDSCDGGDCARSAAVTRKRTQGNPLYAGTFLAILITSGVKECAVDINSAQPAIMFTLECRKTNGIASVKVLVKRKGSPLAFSVYKEPTRSMWHLSFDSNLSTAQNASVLSTLTQRTKAICLSVTETKLVVESTISYLHLNGYTNLVPRVIRRLPGNRNQTRLLRPRKQPISPSGTPKAEVKH